MTAPFLLFGASPQSNPGGKRKSRVQSHRGEEGTGVKGRERGVWQQRGVVRAMLPWLSAGTKQVAEPESVAALCFISAETPLRRVRALDAVLDFKHNLIATNK